MFLIYGVLYAIALFFLFPFEFLKRPGVERARWLREKFGFVEGAKEGSIWVHAVSVGEVNAAATFIEALALKGHADNVILSTITDTGQQAARQRLPGRKVIYMPFDLPFALKGAIRRLRPATFVIVETELWPNAIRMMKRFGVPVIVVNGRLSEGSFKNYFKFRFFMRRVLEKVDTFFMQESVYAQRAIALGAKEDAVRVTGNFKFEAVPRGEAPSWLSMLRFPAVVAGSTHRGEEELVARAAKRLLACYPALSLVVVPRHPARRDEAARALESAGIEHVFSSAIRPGTAIPTAVIVDTIGQLFQIYAAADVAVVCGSFVAHGGQNPLEPAYWGKAVVCGPHMENFPFVEEMKASGGALVVDEEGLFDALQLLLGDAKRREALGMAARKFYFQKTGAVGRTVEAFLTEVFPDGAL